MLEQYNQNPFQLKINSIKLYKFDGSEYLDIRPQAVQVNIFQSIFQPLVKCEIVMLDQIGLFDNFPLTGEEFIAISLQQPSNTNDAEDDTLQFEHLFVIDYIDNIEPSDKLRDVTYRLGLISIEAYVNSRQKISRLFDNTISQSVSDMINNYLITPTKYNFLSLYDGKQVNIEPTLNVVKLKCPMMNPLRFIQLATNYAVAADRVGAKYLFFENNRGLNFVSLEYLQNDSIARANAIAEDNQYVFVANHDVGDKTIDNDQRTYRTITELHVNKRFSSFEKITAGYFENLYFETNLFTKQISITGNQYSDSDTKLDENSFNSDQYIAQAKTIENIFTANIDRIDIANRVKYAYNNNREDAISSSWGRAQRTLIGLSQIDLTITVPGDYNLNAGDLIYCVLPENHGYNDIDSARYVNGLFLISEVKHSIINGGHFTTVLRINKNSFDSGIEANSVFTEAVRQ